MTLYHFLPFRMTTHDTTPPAHTPGPWHIDLQSPYSPVCIKPYPGEVVCDIEGTGPEAEANARLIAAAPDLLAAVHSARAACEARIGVLAEEKRELIGRGEEFADQAVIDHYCALLEECDEVITRATFGPPNDPFRTARLREMTAAALTTPAPATHPCPHCGERVDAGAGDPASGRCDPCAVAEETDLAFGRVLVRRFPHAVSGDLSPGASVRMSRAVRDAAAEWIQNNVLPEESDGNRS